MSNNIISKARNKYKAGKLGETLELLGQTRLKSKADTLLSRLNGLNRKFNGVQLTQEEHGIEENKIRNEIDELLKQLEAPPPTPNPPRTKPLLPKNFIEALETQINSGSPLPDFFNYESLYKMVTTEYLIKLLRLCQNTRRTINQSKWQYESDRNEAYRSLIRLQKWLDDFKVRLTDIDEMDSEMFDFISGGLPFIEKMLDDLIKEDTAAQVRLRYKSNSLLTRLNSIIEELEIKIELAEVMES